MPLVLLPSIAILKSTFVNVPYGTMTNHDAEEHRIEPGEGAAETSNQASRESKKHHNYSEFCVPCRTTNRPRYYPQSAS